MPPQKNFRYLLKGFLLLSGLIVLPIEGHAKEVTFGSFEVVNSAGFREAGGKKTPLSKDEAIGVSVVSLSADGDTLTLSTGETHLNLYRIATGLQGLEWNAADTSLLHREDILALSRKKNLSEVETWGAAIDWPGAGRATMVMFRLNEASFAGFLVSKPGSSTLVRQMEFHLLAGPRHRSPQDREQQPRPERRF